MGKHETGYADIRPDKDLFPTPSWVTDALAEHIELAGKILWEPAVGSGIMAEALAAASDIDPELLKQALAYYCGNRGYLRACCVAGAVRIDLAGNEAGHVSAEAAAQAEKRLVARQQRQLERMKAKTKLEPDPETDPAPPELDSAESKLEPDPTPVPESAESGGVPVRLGFAGLRQAAKARKAALTKLEANGAQADSCAHSG